MNKSKKIKEKDSFKNEFLKSIGFEILRIKEKDYKINPLDTLHKCLEFLTKEKINDT